MTHVSVRASVIHQVDNRLPKRDKGMCYNKEGKLLRQIMQHKYNISGHFGCIGLRQLKHYSECVSMTLTAAGYAEQCVVELNYPNVHHIGPLDSERHH